MGRAAKRNTAIWLYPLRGDEQGIRPALRLDIGARSNCPVGTVQWKTLSGQTITIEHGVDHDAHETHRIYHNGGASLPAGFPFCMAQEARELTSSCVITSPNKKTDSVHDGEYTSFWRSRTGENPYLEFQTPEGEAAQYLYICLPRCPKRGPLKRRRTASGAHC